MSLTRKLAVAVSVWGVVLIAAYFYFGHFERAYYFPGRYEDAFTAMAYSIVGGIVVLVAIGLSHLLTRRR